MEPALPPPPVTARALRPPAFPRSLFLFAALVLFLGAARLGAQGLVISEFVAANNAGERDEDGEFNDWIEIYNPEPDAASLAGWYLTDDARNLTLWQFPDVPVSGRGFLVVFASGKDRRDPQGKLHTNFRLGRDGEYLGLVRPDGATVASAFAPAFPRQLSDVSYGLTMTTQVERLVAPQAAARILVPTNGLLGLTWTQPEFNDASWSFVTMGLGYALPPSTNDPPEPNPALADVTQPGDYLVPTSSNSPGNEGGVNAIDNNPNTKYLNFDKLNAGFTVSPAAGPTTVSGLRFTSANDSPERDPTSFALSGSTDGQTFVPIAQGKVPFFTGRFTPVAVSFANSLAYNHYRLLFPTISNATAAVAVQIAEVEFLGYVGAPPSDFAALITTSVQSLMFGRRPSVYVRLPFTVEQVQPSASLVLRAQYEDGFAAWLNGVLVAGANAPATLAYNSTATTNRFRREAGQEQRFDLSPFAGLLHPGTNVLALQGLNDRTNSSDFLLCAQLENTQITLGQAGYFETPTAGAPNATASIGLVSDLTFNRPRGFYDTNLEVAISCATANTVIRCTTNGSVPTLTNGFQYAGPIRLARTTLLRAAGFREGWRPSRVATHTYIFLNDVITQTASNTLAAGFPANWISVAADYGLDPRVVNASGSDSYGGKYTRTFKSDLQSLPSMSIVMNREDMFGPLGIYANPTYHGAAWERAASLELIYPDNHPGFQEDAGIRVQGGAFRRFDLTMKKSFRMVFREQYGHTTLCYPLFGTQAATEFDTFTLRASSNDGWPYGGGSAVYVRDPFAMESARAMGRVSSHSTFVHLYINGLYWGLYNPVERPDAAFSATYYGGDKATWDAINQDSAPDGTYDAWNRLLSLLNLDMSATANYQRLQGNNPDGTRNPAYEDLLDVENMIDYMILNHYAGNTDWPGRNWWVGRDRNNGDGFKFYPWDTETALGMTGLQVDVTGANGAVARPYAAVRANAEFRLRFADHVYRHFSSGGTFYVNSNSPVWNPARPEDNRPAARFAALADQVSRAIVGESARWGDQLRSSPYTRDESWLPSRNSLLTNFFPYRSGIVLDQFRRAGLYPRTDPPVMNTPGGHVASDFQLTLTAPQGTIYYTTNGDDPRPPGATVNLSNLTLVARAASKKVLVPSTANAGDKLGTNWLGGREPFNESAWRLGAGGVGYDRETTYLPYLETDLRTTMDTKNCSAFIRIPFDFQGDPTWLTFLTLRVQYDDGFAAFLNGVPIASANAPQPLLWNSAATAGNADAAAVNFQEFNADVGLPALKVGRNILAIQGLNTGLTSTDFLLAAELVAGKHLDITFTNTALVYAGPITLNDVVTVKSRVFNGQEWSALNEAAFVAGTPILTLTELHYHPAGPDAAETADGYTDANDFEFLELFNRGTATLDLDGVHFTSGVQFDFTGSAITNLPPGQYVLVVRRKAAFEKRYGAGLPIAGEYAGRLDSSGERITIADAQGQVLLDFIYGTLAPWPAAPDGAGPSLEIIDPKGALGSAANWRASGAIGGSPGKPNPGPRFNLKLVSLEAGELRFTFDGQAGLPYTVYVLELSSAPAWQVLQRGQPLSQSQPVEIKVPVSPAAPTRFFTVSIP